MKLRIFFREFPSRRGLGRNEDASAVVLTERRDVDKTFEHELDFFVSDVRSHVVHNKEDHLRPRQK